MASREEILIGYQLINKTNMGNDLTHNTAFIMQAKTPLTEEPLIYRPPGTLGELAPRDRNATIDDVKVVCEQDCRCVDVEISERLDGFLSNYPDRDQITKGLAYYSTPVSAIEDDKSEVLTHTPNVRTAMTLSNSIEALRPSGELLSLYSERTEARMVHAVHMPKDVSSISTYQNVLNAIADELQGLSSYTGETKYLDVKAIKVQLRDRFLTARRLWPSTPTTLETQRWKALVNEVEAEFKDAETLKDLADLGKHLDDNIALAPLVRRWWKYNG